VRAFALPLAPLRSRCRGASLAPPQPQASSHRSPRVTVALPRSPAPASARSLVRISPSASSSGSTLPQSTPSRFAASLAEHSARRSSTRSAPAHGTTAASPPKAESRHPERIHSGRDRFPFVFKSRWRSRLTWAPGRSPPPATEAGACNLPGAPRATGPPRHGTGRGITR
jgi:hypothetical protein